MTRFNDTKNWTWVLERACPECGFDASSFPARDVPGRLREIIPLWRDVLLKPDLTRRPAENVWSPLEYACHVRDVFIIFDDRVDLMIREDDPLFKNWDQDASAVEGNYSAQDSITVGGDLEAAGNRLADRLDSVSGSVWDRQGRRSDGSTFTVDSIARYMVHDPIHHLHDVGVDSRQG